MRTIVQTVTAQRQLVDRAVHETMLARLSTRISGIMEHSAEN